MVKRCLQASVGQSVIFRWEHMEQGPSRGICVSGEHGRSLPSHVRSMVAQKSL